MLEYKINVIEELAKSKEYRTFRTSNNAKI